MQRATCGADFIQLSGEDATALGFNAHGGVGCISVTANVAPRLCAEFQAATLAGDYAKALEYQDRLMPLHEAIFIEPGLVGAKYGLSLLGLCTRRGAPAAGRADRRHQGEDQGGDAARRADLSRPNSFAGICKSFRKDLCSDCPASRAVRHETETSRVTLTENQRGALFMTASMAGFAVEDVFVKAAAATLPLGQVLLTIGLVGMLVFAAMAAPAGRGVAAAPPSCRARC